MPTVMERVVALAQAIGAEVKAVKSAKADDSAVLHKSGNETKSGTLTFGSPPVIPTGTLDGHPVRRDDTRLTDSRVPVAHKSSHAIGGSDVLSPADIGAPRSFVQPAAPAAPSVGDVWVDSDAASGMGTLWLDVRDYGATGDGTTDDSAAFQGAYAAAVAAVAPSYSIPGELMGRVSIYVPPGRYRITEPESLIESDSPAALTMGLNFTGAGQGISEILFDPATGPGSYLCHNNRWRQLTFRDLSFLSGTAGSSFMKSVRVAPYSVQDYRFERVLWDGSWEYGLALSGDNNNSEFVFDQCSVHGWWTEGFLYSGVVPGVQAQDQFLNYSFRDCKVEYQSGDFCVFPYGGNINVVGGSLILGDTAAAGCFFSMPDVGGHFEGCQRLFVQGVRFELRGLGHKVIDCHWNNGTVHFDSITDTAHQGILAGIENLVTARYSSHNVGGPTVLYTSCELVGQHEYVWGVIDCWKRALPRYESCVLRSWTEPEEFVLRTPTAGAEGNIGSAAVVEFLGCKGGATSTPWLYPPDQSIGWRQAAMAQPKRRVMSFKGPYGNLPFAADPTLHLWLPTGSVVTGVRFMKPAGGSSTSTNWTYTLTNEAGATLASIGGGGTTQWLNGFSSTVAVDNVPCDLDTTRHLILTSANIDQTLGTSMCVVEYFG